MIKDNGHLLVSQFLLLKNNFYYIAILKSQTKEILQIGEEKNISTKIRKLFNYLIDIIH